MSADLVGSTARKQLQGDSTWLGDVLAFYQQFPYHLDKELTASVRRKRVKDYDIFERPALWKPVGDELIYSAEVRSEHDVCVIVDAWMAAMEATNRSVLEKAGMTLKGAAWLATFPLPDRAVAVPMIPATYDPNLEPEVVNRQLLELPDAHNSDVIDLRQRVDPVRIDYLGPSIDIGFRVAHHASARQFTLTVETAWAIAVSRQEERDMKPIYFGGEVELTGVWEGRGYPLFWLDTGNHHSAQPTVDKITGLARTELDLIRELAAELRTTGLWPCRLYLEDSNKPEFSDDRAELERESLRLSKIVDTSSRVPEL